MMRFEDLLFFSECYIWIEIPITIRKLVWGLLIHDVLGSNLGARRFLTN